MKIVVLVKAVPMETDVTLTSEMNIDREKTQLNLNIADLSSVEAALCAKESADAASKEADKVEAISMGTMAVKPLLLDLVASGVDSVSLVSDRLLAGADTYATAFALSRAIPKDVDYIFAGRRAMDGETGQVPSEIAAHLGYNIVTNVTSIERVDVGNDTYLKAKRRTETSEEIVFVPKRSIISFCEYSYALRLPGIFGKRNAMKAEVKIITVEDLGLTAEQVGLKGSLTRVLKTHFFSQEKRKGPRTEDLILAGKEIAAMVKDGRSSK